MLYSDNFHFVFSPNIALQSEMSPVEQLLQEDLILEFSENCASLGIYLKLLTWIDRIELKLDRSLILLKSEFLLNIVARIDQI